MPDLNLEARIEYWRSRASVAKRLRLETEAEGCEAICSKLKDLLKTTRQVEATVEKLFNQMPEENFESEGR